VRPSSRPLLVMLGSLPLAAAAMDVTVPREGNLSVTVYRAPDRPDGPLSLDNLNGFALVTETRTVNVPQGDNRIRFEGVADGIEAESALITGLPDAVIEKNRDNAVLTPEALIKATLGKSVMIARTNPKTGKVKRIPAKIRSDGGGSVLVETAEGIEAVHCSGLPEAISFITHPDLSSTPTLSARVRSPTATTAKVTLSYLARGFDWTANYTATLAADQKSMDLGAWVTLANSNGTGFPSAKTQIVAGRVNHESGGVEPLETEPDYFATCWPISNTTSGLRQFKLARAPAPRPEAASAMINEVVVTGARAELVKLEQLGDLKLYRVPERTTLNSRQIKQVRLLDRRDIPVELFYGADLIGNTMTAPTAARKTIRTRNDPAHHLGLPLPSGQVSSFITGNGATLLLDEVPMRDTAVDEEIELNVGTTPDVQVKSVKEKTNIYTRPPFLEGVVRFKSSLVDEINRIDIQNSTPAEIKVELRLQLPDGTQVIAADAATGRSGSRTIFKLPVPPNRTATVRYQTEHISMRPAGRK
jgi:hypothetical protein